MVSLTKLVKAIIYTALLNKVVKGSLISTLMRSLSRILQPSTILAVGALIAALLNQRKSNSASQAADNPKNLQTMLERILASMFLMATNGIGLSFTEAEANSATRRILSTLMRSMEGFSSAGHGDNRSKVIESNDYKVVYDR